MPEKSAIARRTLLKLGVTTAISPFIGSAAAPILGRSGPGISEISLPPARMITQGPLHHWFGYYDKQEFDPSGRYVLGMSVDFEHRSPRPDDRITIGMVDLQDQERWIELGTSTAWCWQQGCMLQWLPGSSSQIIWNDRQNGQYVCHLLDVTSGVKTTIPHPIYAVSPDGRTAISTDFRRLGDTRPGYGYNGISDPYFDQATPELSGVFRIDLTTGQQQLILSVAQVAAFGTRLASMRNSKHWFNHLLFNPDGTRFVFLHRWQVGKGRETRMLTAAPDGSDLRVLDANGLTSHFFWQDPTHILAWSDQKSHGKRFYLFEDGGEFSVTAVGAEKMVADAHCSYLPDTQWILNDSYPDAARLQHPCLYHVPSDTVIPLGHFHSPLQYTGEWRCDTHPRLSRDGRMVVIDSPHGGSGRQLTLIEIGEILDRVKT